jgi:hypothetical protein
MQIMDHNGNLFDGGDNGPSQMVIEEPSKIQMFSKWTKNQCNFPRDLRKLLLFLKSMALKQVLEERQRDQQQTDKCQLIGLEQCW